MDTNTTPSARSRTARHHRRHTAGRPCVITLLVALLLTACGGTAGPGGGTAAPDGDWELRSGTSAGVEVPIIDGHDITLAIDGETWGGTAACNSYDGMVQVDGSQVSVAGFGMTEMGCPEDGVMESEAQYVEALQRVSDLEVAGDQLTLRDSSSDTELIFDRRAP